MRTSIKFTAPIILLVLIAAACGSDGGDNPAQPDRPTPTESSVDADPSPEPTKTVDQLVVIAIEVSNGQVDSAQESVDVPLGETVEIEVTADTDDEVHVHGYDIIKDTVAGEPVSLRFTADIPGVFEVELEDASLLLVELRVQ